MATKAAIYTVYIYVAQTLCERYAEFRNISKMFCRYWNIFKSYLTHL